MNEYILNEIIEIIHRVDVKEWKEADRVKICRHIEERMKECNCTEDEILRALKEGRKYNWSTYATFISLRTNHRCKWGVCCGGINFKASVFNYSLFTIEHKNGNILKANSLIPNMPMDNAFGRMNPSRRF